MFWWSIVNKFIAESLYPVKTKYIVADFSNGKEIYDEIERQLSGIPVGILGKLFQGFLFAVGVAKKLQHSALEPQHNQ